jgi:hypothetical protein
MELVTVDVDGEELFPSIDGVSEPCRDAVAVILWSEDAVLDRRGRPD